MSSIQFKYTNKQQFLGCMMIGCLIIFLGAFLYILFNIADFWESHALEVVFILVMGVGIIFSTFFRAKGTEWKKNVTLSAQELGLGNQHRFPLEGLQLDVYTQNSKTYYHLYNTSKNFTLYTYETDALIAALLTSKIKINHFELTHYDFDRNHTVAIKTKEGREMAFNLDSGAFNLYGPEADGQVGRIEKYLPDFFIQVPTYKKMS